MGEAEAGRIILMSIHPEFADAILRGSKRVEFRKKRIPDDVTHVVVYATRPVAAIVGAFSVDGLVTNSPQSLWESFEDVAGIAQGEFDDYFESRHEGTGICVGEVFLADEVLHLAGAFGLRRPPQSYQYVDSSRAASLLSQMTRFGED